MGRTWLALACLVLAGCAGPSGEPAHGEGSRATGTVVDDGAPVANATTGRVVGLVINDAGLQVAGALVLILSIESSVQTDRNGSFSFGAVAPGKQTLRVEKENYQTLVQQINVIAGKQLRVEVVLVPVEGVNPGFLDHFHDHWRGSDIYTVFDGTLEWDDEIDQDMKACQGIASGQVPLDDRGCQYLDIVLDEGRIVPPGTKELQVTVEYTSPLGHKPRFYIDPPDYACENSCYNTKSWPLVSGETFVLPMEPLWTDHGHAQASGWSFYVHWADSVSVADVYYMPVPITGSAWNSMMKSPVTVKIEAIPGELAIDPPHPRFWQDNDTVLLTDAGTYLNCLACDGIDRTPTVQTRYECYSHCILFNVGEIVPPGATQLEFTLQVSWQGRNAAVDATYDTWAQQFMIGYKTPDIGMRRGTWDDYVWPDPIETTQVPFGQNERYSIALAPEHADAWYDTYSQWMFSIAIEDEPDADAMTMTCPVYMACPYAHVLLKDIRVIDEDLEAQREAGLI